MKKREFREEDFICPYSGICEKRTIMRRKIVDAWGQLNSNQLISRNHDFDKLPCYEGRWKSCAWYMNFEENTRGLKYLLGI